ncbi:MAG: hypothetical protein IPK65_09065 [Gammaproteobacteria bacterium]|nr:hypothetical protein [Gammaproteobacteria bacterium]
MMKLNEIVHPSEASATSLTLTFELRQRSRQRVTLDDGRAAALMLVRGTVLRGGDRVRADDGTVVGVVAAPEPVSTVSCPDPHLLARACYHLGNRHIPLQVGAGWLRYQQDARSRAAGAAAPEQLLAAGRLVRLFAGHGIRGGTRLDRRRGDHARLGRRPAAA